MVLVGITLLGCKVVEDRVPLKTNSFHLHFGLQVTKQFHVHYRVFPTTLKERLKGIKYLHNFKWESRAVVVVFFND